jgi:3-isopropylmalate dehydrogenase
MFEPIHGSAPKHAGKDRANPFAMILAIKEGLVWVAGQKKLPDLARVARKIEDAVAAQIAEGKPLTYDLVGEDRAARTSVVGDAVRERFLKLAR